MHHLAIVSATLTAVIWLFSVVYSRSRIKASLPPSPPASWLLGHLRLVPRFHPERVWHNLSKTYGDVVYLRVPGRSIVVLNSLASATEIMEKRGQIYSDRPEFRMLVDIMGWTPTLTFLRQSDRFKKQRKMIQQFLSPGMLKTAELYQTTGARTFASKLTNATGEELLEHTKLYVMSIVMEIAFGHTITGPDDPYVKLGDDVTYTIDNSGAPGASPPDLIGFLRFIPGWVPGAWWTKFGNQWRWVVRKLHDYPIQQIQKQMASGTARPSMIFAALEAANGTQLPDHLAKEHLEDIKGLAANTFCAGNDTTWASTLSFILAMTLHPEVQARAREEIDRVVGPDRLPSFDDRKSLPYVEGVVQEVLRWRPVVPCGVPHKSIKDDIYNGYFIPAGSLIIANAYAISLDENVYHDPESFKPERFLPKELGGNEEPVFAGAFGFGRRVCPGRQLAENTLWSAAVTLLATVTFTRPKDDQGNFLEHDYKYTTGGVVSHPLPFKTVIKSRSAAAEHLITMEAHHSDI